MEWLAHIWVKGEWIFQAHCPLLNIIHAHYPKCPFSNQTWFYLLSIDRLRSVLVTRKFRTSFDPGSMDKSPDVVQMDNMPFGSWPTTSLKGLIISSAMNKGRGGWMRSRVWSTKNVLKPISALRTVSLILYSEEVPLVETLLEVGKQLHTYMALPSFTKKNNFFDSPEFWWRQTFKRWNSMTGLAQNCGQIFSRWLIPCQISEAITQPKYNSQHVVSQMLCTEKLSKT